MSDLCFVFYTEVMLVVIFVVSNVLCSCASPLCLELVSLKANIFLHFLLWLFLAFNRTYASFYEARLCLCLIAIFC